MARRPRRAEADPVTDTPVEEEPRLTEAEIMQGDPRTGTVVNADDPEDDDQDDTPAEPKRERWEDAIDEFRREQNQMMQQLIGALAQNRGGTPAGADGGVRETAEGLGLPEADIEDLMFRDPAKLIKLIEDNVGRKIEARLTTKYTQESNKKDFWTQFYAKHSDLDDDRDLVDSTLSRHMADLKDMPADKAMDKLATLTRTRIAGYVASRRTGRKATAESGGAPSGRTGTQPATTTRVAPETLSQALRRRAEVRRSSRGRAA